MMYRAIGLMSGSSLDGLDIVFAEFVQVQGKWTYQIEAADCIFYPVEWQEKLRTSPTLSGRELMHLDALFGQWVAEAVNNFIDKNELWHRVQLIGNHGHTVFHDPVNGFTTQIGCGATIAGRTGINTVAQLRQMDVALRGQGAPIVPAGEKELLPGYRFYLNLGGIANISVNQEPFIAFDVSPANRVLNMLAGMAGLEYDRGGALAATGLVQPELLSKLNQDSYYSLKAPKSLANELGAAQHFPLVVSSGASIPDMLATYAEHIAVQIAEAIRPFISGEPEQLLITGGGALNTFLVGRIKALISPFQIKTVVPDMLTVNYKEALIMAFLGVLRWREENTIISSVSGASRSSIGGAVWIGQEA